MSTKTKADQLEWRRAKVVEMRARGMSQIEIARELQVSEASISSDMRYLRARCLLYTKHNPMILKVSNVYYWLISELE